VTSEAVEDEVVDAKRVDDVSFSLAFSATLSREVEFDEDAEEESATEFVSGGNFVSVEEDERVASVAVDDNELASRTAEEIGDDDEEEEEATGLDKTVANEASGTETEGMVISDAGNEEEEGVDAVANEEEEEDGRTPASIGTEDATYSAAGATVPATAILSAPVATTGFSSIGTDANADSDMDSATVAGVVPTIPASLSIAIGIAIGIEPSYNAAPDSSIGVDNNPDIAAGSVPATATDEAAKDALDNPDTGAAEEARKGEAGGRAAGEE